MRDHAGQADATGDVLVLVDRVVVTAGRGVGDQVGAGDPVGRRAPSRLIVAAPGAPGWRVPVQTRAPAASVIALVVPMMSAPPIWRSARDGQLGA